MVCNNNYVILKDRTHNLACEEIKLILLLRNMDDNELTCRD